MMKRPLAAASLIFVFFAVPALALNVDRKTVKIKQFSFDGLIFF